MHGLDSMWGRPAAYYVLPQRAGVGKDACLEIAMLCMFMPTAKQAAHLEGCKHAAAAPLPPSAGSGGQPERGPAPAVLPGACAAAGTADIAKQGRTAVFFV